MLETNSGWRSGQLDHDLPLSAALPHAYPGDFEGMMQRLSGGTSFDEATYLVEQARVVTSGCILEVGSFKGRSAVALSVGARAGGHGAMIYCIEPHAAFVGVYGGIYGPSDRAQFYQAMLATGSYQNTALINLSSEKVASAWTIPISLCFIDGDHTYAGVRRDFDCWAGKIEEGGLLILDDTNDKSGGPARLKIEIERMDEWNPVPAPGKFAAFRKRSLVVARLVGQPT